MNKLYKPDCVFEISWEVCNKVGGIYTVLSSKAQEMQHRFDRVVFIGPDLKDRSDIYFEEEEVLPLFRKGRWKIEGRPEVILVTWNHLYPSRDAIYAQMWDHFRVESHAAYGDYDDCALFSYAAGQIVEQIILSGEIGLHPLVAHANEWQTVFFLLYLRIHCPQVATVFTTHATCIGRSIAGNGKPLYKEFFHYNGDQMAHELNMVSKHSVEKHGAHVADCFTTVSELTSRECHQLLEKSADIVTPNGFNDADYKQVGRSKLKESIRRSLCEIVKDVLNVEFESRPFFICTSGRCEWHNKGIDIFIDSMYRLDKMISSLQSDTKPYVTAFVFVPFIKHENLSLAHVGVLFVPHYLDGYSIPICSPYANLRPYLYYDLLSCMDISIYPSYYEPWGYTPLESCVMDVPTITTSLSGFGLWVKGHRGSACTSLRDGVCVIDRNDTNTDEVIKQITEQLLTYILCSDEQKIISKKNAKEIARTCDWKHFITYYEKAYDFALQSAKKR